ncbi:AMP-binding protein [Stackebrandtia nassauensis]|uniref:AMP-dependent synthetase and ligase n=1 Tax=Stackebrandtia nassauensis (strain DSM 44728 / CIP 108903 / NRRL B-16338 / NBRC 102104 / LLR-40K-21) TaxID=446470 RepID=D3Q9H9_STANL|nr:AMP-binding protein [Stackebrandtia nassauensis]ADD42661.1 AMP-dependent synthetase and ligase [Stackebrandtia nassauensis DSM 44728]
MTAAMKRAVRALGTGWHIGSTMARRGLLTPGRPDRVVRQVSTLARWGLGLAGEFASAARRDPEWTAVVDEDGPVSFAELDERTDRLARVLAEGRPEGPPRVAVLCRNHTGMIATLIACGKLGADAVLFNTGLSAQQVRQAVDDHDIAVLVADTEFLPLPDLPDGVRVIAAEGDGADGLRALAEAAEPGGHSPPAATGRTIVLTSGTTGTPKGARRPKPALHSLTALLSRIPLKVGDRIHIAAPIFHTWGYAALQLAIAMRATIVLRRRFDPEPSLRTLSEHDCTAMFAVPVMLQRLLELPPEVRDGCDTASLRVVATSGSSYPGDLATRFMDAFGDVLYNLYGTTEVSWISIATPEELRAHPDTSGRPPHGTTVLLLDEDGREVDRGVPGRIFVGNEMLFEGYTDGSRRSTFDGTMDSGDLGHRDESGLLYVDGRADDMIISGGENVFPSEVENLLARLPQVREVAVVGVADEEFGQRLVAHVVVAEGHELDAETVRDHVRTHLARFSVPRDVRFLEQLPRNATGKVVPRLLGD